MAFPTVAGTQPTFTSSNNATPTIDLPANVAAGDLVLVIGGKDGNGTVTWPGAGATWQEMTDAAFTGGMYTAAYLIASGGETTVVPTFTVAERSTFIAVRIPASSWHGTTPPEISTVATGNSNSPNAASRTASWGAEDNLWLTWFVADDSALAFPVTAFPYADNNVQEAGATSSVDVAMATRELNAASEDPGAFTMTGSETWAAFTIVVRPAAGGGGATFALAGTAAATAAMTGVISHRYAISGAANASASMTGAIAHTYSLAGLATALASMTGDATVTAPGATFALAGTMAAAASMTGALTHSYGLAGTANASGAMTGALTHVYSLAGLAAATAAMAGDMTSGIVTFGDAVITFVVRHDASIDFSVRHAAALTFPIRHEATLTFP